MKRSQKKMSWEDDVHELKREKEAAEDEDEVGGAMGRK